MAQTVAMRSQDDEEQAKRNVPQITLVAKKKLPWLDNAKENPDAAKQLPHLQPRQKCEHPDPAAPRYIPPTSLCTDLRYRPTGSTPEIREMTRPRGIRSHSQSSQRPAGLTSPLLAREMAVSSHALSSYASSEYSSASAPSDYESLPRRFPKKEPASYERLVRPLESPMPGWTQSMVPRDENHAATSPRGSPTRGTTRPKPKPSLYQPCTSRINATAFDGRRRARGTTPEVRRRSSERRVYHAKRVTLLPSGMHLLEPPSSSSQSLQTGAPTRKAVPGDLQAPKPPTGSQCMPARALRKSDCGAVKQDLTTLPTSLTSARPPHSDLENSATRLYRSQLRRLESHLPGDFSATSSTEQSISRTPPRLYRPPSADCIVRDFAHTRPQKQRRHSVESVERAKYGAAATYYGDHGQSVAMQPGIRHSVVPANTSLPIVPLVARANPEGRLGKQERVQRAHKTQNVRHVAASVPERPLRRMQLSSAAGLRASQTQSHSVPDQSTTQPELPTQSMQPTHDRDQGQQSQKDPVTSEPDAIDLSLKNPRVNHISVREGDEHYLRKYHKPRPIARDWPLRRKRLTSFVACLNTIFVGLIAGIYAGEVPRIQYQLEDTTHWVIFGNMLLFAGLGLSTVLFWPLPLLHGRRPYTLIAFGIMLPLQIPQAMIVQSVRGPAMLYRAGLLVPRVLTGFAMGFANINFLPTLWDLWGASLMSDRPHQEIVAYDDVRRQGGGIGVWLGLWTFCFSSSLSIGFFAGACIISKLNPSWGFWISVILLSFFLLLNMIAPETRRSEHRRFFHQFFENKDEQQLKRRIARGEVKLHISNDGPRWWYEEVWAGLTLTKRMVCQPGFAVLMLYLGWIQAQLTLVILLLGALLSRDYSWPSHWVGLAALSVPVGAALAMPSANASAFSRSRVTPARTDSMTFHPRFTWSSHFLRRALFTLMLPFAGLGFCMSSSGPPLHWSAAVVFAGLVGFLADLGTAECVGLIMETFDTCDLQPGVNTLHRVQSMSLVAKQRRTNYSCFPRVCAGWFAAQSLGFFLSAGATVAAGKITDGYGAQTAISIVAAILLGATILLLAVLYRWKNVQVIPSYTMGTRRGSKEWDPRRDDPEWKAVIIGKPSGKMRRMNLLELGSWSRWTEIRKLNKLIKE